jgi:hypothetical protein
LTQAKQTIHQELGDAQANPEGEAPSASSKAVGAKDYQAWMIESEEKKWPWNWQVKFNAFLEDQLLEHFGELSGSLGFEGVSCFFGCRQFLLDQSILRRLFTS